MRTLARRPVQLTLDDARSQTGRGGWRRGAGRPRGPRSTTHDARRPVRAREPQHVTLRLASGLPSIRRRDALAVVRGAVHEANGAVREANGGAHVRIVHFHVLSNHVHLLVEADSAPALGRALQRCCVRLARGFNRILHRTGTVFAERYHVRALATPTEVRNALRYVLLNSNHHERDRGARALWYGCDAYSSAAWFDGWADDRWRHERADTPCPVAGARTWLLREGWRRAGGPLAFDDTPGRRSCHDR
jgi:REP element-mobilizing transposase RayT